MKHPLLARWAAVKLRKIARDPRCHPDIAEFLTKGAALAERDHTKEEIDAICDEFLKSGEKSDD
jgi:hypothetical protein